MALGCPCGLRDSIPGMVSLYIRMHLIYVKFAHAWAKYHGLNLESQILEPEARGFM